jgi:hypothetical protein
LEKTFEFEDGSLARFTIKDGSLIFFIQAKHLGKEIKTTATTVSLTKEETVELVNLMAHTLTDENI